MSDEPRRPAPAPLGGGRTGVLVTFHRDGLSSAIAGLRNLAGIQSVAAAADFDSGAVDLSEAAAGDLIVFDRLGVAIASVDPGQLDGMVAAAGDDAGIRHMEPEPVFWALERSPVDELAAPAGGFRDSATRTWGLAATGVVDAAGTGRGVRVAVLDTGIDLDHPDFTGRDITAESFIPGQPVRDDNGHGTHCAGTAAGTRMPTRGPRYGIASEAELFVAKVLSDQGSARGRSTLAGIEWALRNGCQVISMSLGAPVDRGEPFSPAFEQIGRAALDNDALIVAAAGNDSERTAGLVSPVNSPANCPSIMAVAAVDRMLRVADFSCGAVNPDGRVDICGPGVDVLSSAPDPAAPPQPPSLHRWRARTDSVSGTSQATPHVAGVAALLREAEPDTTARDLWQLLVSRARALPLPARDVGAGLVQA